MTNLTENVNVSFCSICNDYIGNKKMVGEAGDCYEWWTCKGEEQCRGKCKDEYKGIGKCDELSPGPGIPRGCNCNYHCKYPPL